MSIKMNFIFTFFQKKLKIFKNNLAKIGAVFAIFLKVIHKIMSVNICLARRFLRPIFSFLT
jgi:hypothetical protein